MFDKHVLQYDIPYITIELSEDSVNSALVTLRKDRKIISKTHKRSMVLRYWKMVASFIEIKFHK